MNSISIVQGVNYGKYSFFKDTGLIYKIDDGFTAVTGYTQKDIDDGLTMLDLVPKSDLNEYIDMVNKSLVGKDECYLEHKITKKNGECIYVLCYGHDSFDDRLNKLISNVLIADVTDSIKAKQGYSYVQDMFNKAMDNVPCGIAMYGISRVDQHFSIEAMFVNSYYWKLYGYDSENDFLNSAKAIGQILDRDSYKTFKDSMMNCYDNRIDLFNGEYKSVKKDGSYIWCSYRCRLYYDNKFNMPTLYVVVSNITEFKKKVNLLNIQNERYLLIQKVTNELYFEYNFLNDTITLPENVETYCTNKAKSNVIHKFIEDMETSGIVHPQYQSTLVEEFKKTLNDDAGKSYTFRMKLYPNNEEYQWCRADYIAIKDEADNTIGVFGKIVDISENYTLKNKIESDKNTIRILSSTDTLTGLLNKTSFCNRFDNIISKLEISSNTCCAMISADINDFSYVNDNFSYEAGNNMLIEYAEVLKRQDIFLLTCRIYSDYFYCFVYSHDITRDELLTKLKDINYEFDSTQKKNYPAGSICICAGVYFLESNAVNSTICMDNSNLARRSIKGHKFHKLAIYNQEMHTKRSREKAIGSELNTAIANGKLELFLQPKFNVKTKKIIGAEALSRWRNDDGSLRSPATFIPVLEKLGYIVQLDFYMFERVLICMKKWKDDGINLIPISINFSRVNNNYEDFVDRIINLTDAYEIPHNLIEIEITESAFANNNTILMTNMKRLQDNGFKIDIDDFGIGYSSLSVILDAPIDIVKIDKKFVDDVEVSKKKQDFVRQLCILISTTNKDIIFEGVELQQQADFLSDCGFYMVQGWLFDKAIHQNEFEKKYIYV